MIKEYIEQKFSSINKFCQSIDKTVLSKQTVYKLVASKKPNPTVTTMIALAHYLSIDYLEVAALFKRAQEVKPNEDVNS